MKKILFIFLLLLIVSCGDENSNTPEKDTPSKLKIDAKKDNNGYLIGVADKESFTDDPDFKTWFISTYNNYNPESEILEELKTYIKDIRIRAYLGTWCGDSRREIPRFYKIMDSIAFTNFDVIALGRDKKANGLEKGYKVNYVPIFIIYKDKKELGRFIESVTTSSLENDLLQIVKENNYTPAR